MRIIIIKHENTSDQAQGKLAAAELHFDEGEPLAGAKLIGFDIWERRGGGLNVTFPARQYTVNGERRSFALVRPTDYASGLVAPSTKKITDAILAAFDEHRLMWASIANAERDATSAAVLFPKFADGYIVVDGKPALKTAFGSRIFQTERGAEAMRNRVAAGYSGDGTVRVVSVREADGRDVVVDDRGQIRMK